MNKSTKTEEAAVAVSTNKKVATPRKTRSQQRAAVAAAGIASTLTPKKVLDELASASLLVQESLRDIGVAITSHFDSLAALDATIADKQGQLKSLFDLAVEAQDLETFRAQKEVEKQEINAQIAAVQEQLKLATEDHGKQLERMQEDLKFQSDVAQRKFDADFEIKKAKAQAEENARTREREEALQKREAAMQAIEDDVAALRKSVSEFDAVLNSRVREAVATATAQMRTAHENQVSLLIKDKEAALRVAEAEKSAMNDRLSHSNEIIQDLREKLDAARVDVRQTIESAMSSVSDRRLAESLQQAMQVGQPTAKK